MENTNLRGFKTRIAAPGILWITFNQPDRLNGFTAAIKRDLVEILKQAQMSDEVSIVVFTGEGKAFCAGDDLKNYRTGFATDPGLVPFLPSGHDNAIGTYNGLRHLSQPVNTAIRELDKLTIAAINGVAIQTGFSLALACDFRIAAESATMGSATLRFGLLPDEGGQYFLVQHLGVARAIDFMMRKRIVRAEEAMQLGLVNEVVPDTDLLEVASDLAKELADGPQVAMRLLKKSIYNAAELNLNQALDEIASKTAVVDHHPDAEEGILAFNEKRKPRFNRT